MQFRPERLNEGLASGDRLLSRSLLITGLVCGCFSLFAADTRASFVKQPLISGVSVSSTTTTSATITWVTSSPASSQVEYGATTAYGNLTPLDTTLVRSHSQVLSGLTPNSLYHFAVISQPSGGTRYVAGDFSFSTPPVVIQGMIGSLTVSGITGTSATISWTTPTPSNSVVEYGNSAANLFMSIFAPEFVTSHTVLMPGLQPGAVYYFRVTSTDAAGNLGTSDVSSFTTIGDQSPSVFSAISASAIGTTSATITWTTSYPAISQIDYGTGLGYGSSTLLDPNLTTSHSQTLLGLAPDTVYHFRLKTAVNGPEESVSADYTFATSSVTLYYPQLGTAPNTYTGVAIADLDSTEARVSFTAFQAAGRELLAADLTNPANKTVAAGAQFAAIQNQLFGSGVSNLWPLGWTMVSSSTPQVAGFFLTFDNALSFMDGTVLSSRLLKSFVLPETGDHDYTTLVIANPNFADASVTLDLVEADGTVRSSMQTTIPANGTYSADLVGGTFAGIAVDPSDYVRAASSQGLLPYEFFGNSSRDVAVLTAQDSADSGTILYAPQYAVGGSWSSTFSIVNLDARPGTITLRWIGDDGSQIGTPQTVPVAAGGKLFISDQSFFQGPAPSPTRVLQGYVQLVSDGIHISGGIVFSDAANGTFITALPLVSTLTRTQVLGHVASDSTYFTGLSILNPDSASATVKIDLYTADGTLDRTTTLTIPAGNRISRLLTQYFPDLTGQDRRSGYIKVSADLGVACFGVFGTNTLSVLAAIPAQTTQ